MDSSVHVFIDESLMLVQAGFDGVLALAVVPEEVARGLVIGTQGDDQTEVVHPTEHRVQGRVLGGKNVSAANVQIDFIQRRFPHYVAGRRF